MTAMVACGADSALLILAATRHVWYILLFTSTLLNMNLHARHVNGRLIGVDLR